MSEKDNVEESGEYDNFIDQTNVVEEPKEANLLEIFGIEEDQDADDAANPVKLHWKGMPEFTQDEKKPFKRLFLSFRNEEDYKEFAKLVDQKLTMKTKSMWYPELDKTANNLLRWIEDDE